MITKEQSVKIMKLFVKKIILPQHSVLDYNNALYFLEHKLAIEVDQKEHTKKDKRKEIER